MKLICLIIFVSLYYLVIDAKEAFELNPKFRQFITNLKYLSNTFKKIDTKKNEILTQQGNDALFNKKINELKNLTDHNFFRSKISFLQSGKNEYVREKTPIETTVNAVINIKPLEENVKETSTLISQIDPNHTNKDLTVGTHRQIKKKQILTNEEHIYLADEKNSIIKHDDSSVLDILNIDDLANDRSIEIYSPCMDIKEKKSCQNDKTCFYDSSYKACFQICSSITVKKECDKFTECQFTTNGCENRGFINLKIFESNLGSDIRGCELFNSKNSCALMQKHYQQLDSDNKTHFNCVWISQKRKQKTLHRIEKNRGNKKRETEHILRNENPLPVAKDEQFISLIEIESSFENNEKPGINEKNKEKKQNSKWEDDTEKEKQEEKQEEQDFEENLDEETEDVPEEEEEQEEKEEEEEQEGDKQEDVKDVEQLVKFEEGEGKKKKKEKEVDISDNDIQIMKKSNYENVNSKREGVEGNQGKKKIENAKETHIYKEKGTLKQNETNSDIKHKEEFKEETRSAKHNLKTVAKHNFRRENSDAIDADTNDNTGDNKDDNTDDDVDYDSVNNSETSICVNLNEKPNPSVLLEAAIIAEHEAELSKVKSKYHVHDNEICVKPEHEHFASLLPNKKFYMAGEKIKFHCKDGYKIIGTTDIGACVGRNQIVPNIICEPVKSLDSKEIETIEKMNNHNFSSLNKIGFLTYSILFLFSFFSLFSHL